MTVRIVTLEGAVETFVEPEPLLFGVRFVADTVGGVVAEGRMLELRFGPDSL